MALKDLRQLARQAGQQAPARASASLWRWLWAWLRGWGQTVWLGAQVLVLALSPSSYRAGRAGLISQRLYSVTLGVLPGFTLLSALVGLVIIRIVLATSLSYGLSAYALGVLVRTLVLELIPLSAALYVAVRYTLAAGDQLRLLRQGLRGGDEVLAWLRDQAMPRMLAALFAVITLAVLSGLLTLLMTYWSVYGLTTWGLAGFTRGVGQVFNPVVGLIFGLKTLAFGLAVSVIPVMSTPGLRGADPALPVNDDLLRLARLLVVILLVEVASLVGNYY
jgi:phospholipid/cholesterol/gamma-HCH transport system permease protein